MAPTPPYASIDFNAGVLSQALGHRAALDMLSGTSLWWNPLEGVGTPLAGEMQSAALLPFTLLLALPDGQLYMQLLFQIIAGVFSFLLMRRIGMSSFAACIAAILFEFNGTYAWMANAVINPIAFMPVILFGVEGCIAAIRGSWRWIASGIALSLYAGFPEVAYIDGLLIAAWTLTRAWRLPRRLGMTLPNVALGVVTGLLLALPILIAFSDYLQNASVLMHRQGFFSQMHLDRALTVNMLLPYIFGLIDGASNFALRFDLWGYFGGYFGASLVVLAVMGMLGRPNRAFRLMLAGWVIICLNTAYGGPFGRLLFLVPGLSNVDFARYYNASSAMALATLAGFALDDFGRAEAPGWRYWASIIVTFLLIAVTFHGAGRYLDHAAESSIGFRNSLLIGAAIFILLIWAGLNRWPMPKRRLILGCLVAFEAMITFTIPTFSNPRHNTLALGGVRFLQQHLGLQRFYSMGVIEPNYGSYFGIAQIDDCDMPIPMKWLNYRNRHLDPNANILIFDGDAHNPTPALPTATAALDRNFAGYLAVGVKYVVAKSGARPFADMPPGEAQVATQVYGDSVMTIYQLAHPRPYFDATGCQVISAARNEAQVNCAQPATLTRLELFMPGWHARLNGKPARIHQTAEIFQGINLPAGRSLLRFTFRPPFMRIGYSGFVLGLLLLALARERIIKDNTAS